MTAFYELPFSGRSMFALWTLLLCCAGIGGIIHSCILKRYRNAAFSLIVFLISGFLWQITLNLYRYGNSEQAERVSVLFSEIRWIYWLMCLLLVSLTAALIIRANIRYSRSYITPVAIKYCGDKMDCGICYWRDNGRILFSNDCMNQLCISLTDRPMTNGNHMFAAVTDSVLAINGKVWKFTHNDVELDNEKVHELLAFDITEIHEKTELLKKENERILKLNDEQKVYSVMMDDIIKRREILQAKIKIHDEMNKLMLSTVAADITNEDEINRTFSLWEEKAFLLGFISDENKKQDSIKQLEHLAKALGIQLEWEGKIPKEFSDTRRELLLTAAQEALANAYKHGKAKFLKIRITEEENNTVCSFENDGKIPSGEISFTGGLYNLNVLAGKEEATVSATAEDCFRLSVSFPKSC